MEQFKGTTIVAVKKGNETVIAGDGQVTMSNSVVMKSTAKKVRRIFDDKVVIGFAGSVADAFSLSSRFEEMLNKFAGNLTRSAVELASQFRLDEIMRKLEALMIVADKDKLLIISGNGEVIEPDNGICAIGSGGNYAYASAKALIENTNLNAEEIARKSLEIAASICVFTNNNITLEKV